MRQTAAINAKTTIIQLETVDAGGAQAQKDTKLRHKINQDLVKYGMTKSVISESRALPNLQNYRELPISNLSHREMHKLSMSANTKKVRNDMTFLTIY